MPGSSTCARRRRIRGEAGLGFWRARWASLPEETATPPALPALPRLRALRRPLGGRRRLLGAPAPAAGALAHLVEAGLQRGHEVRDRRRLLGRGLHGDLLAGRLALDEGEDLLAVDVAVLG